jgi:glycosyltransferase involved in cell wall biosynthesis
MKAVLSASVVGEIRALFAAAQIIVVDDGSDDDTGEVAAQAGATVYRHPYNIGNGAAVKTGIRAATGDILVLMDGDGQHRPEDIKTDAFVFPPLRHGGWRQAGRRPDILAATGRQLGIQPAGHLCYEIHGCGSDIRIQGD